MELENLENHLKTLNKEDWNKLFSLIPRIEVVTQFSTGGDYVEDKDDPDVFSVPPEYYHAIVLEFLDVMEELDLIFGFDWTEWRRNNREDYEGNFKGLDNITLLKILNIYIRMDHMSFGNALTQFFRKGSIVRVVKGMEFNLENTHK